MTEPRSPYAGDDLAELERLYALATPPPWPNPFDYETFYLRTIDGILTLETNIANANLIVALHNAFPALLARLRAAEARAEAASTALAQAREGLQQIVAWSEAYPSDVFPEPDFAKARRLLEAGGITLDSVAASNMRHVITGVAQIAKAALDAAGGEHE